MVATAKRIGPHTSELVDRLLSSKIHPEQAFRPCLGIVRLANRYSEQRLEAACRRALAFSAVSYKSVKSILEKGLDRIEEKDEADPTPVDHRNIRGQKAYADGGRSC